MRTSGRSFSAGTVCSRMGAWGSFDRAAALRRLADGPFDVLVVGGGITGAGVALDAATRGLRTALVERDDFASGTSSKSSKLVHGGLRYLQNGEVRLVYEALRERQRLLRNAPHLVKVLPFLIPIFSSDGLINRKLARAMGSAMWMYDLTGGLRIGKLHKRLSADEALPLPPDARADRLAERRTSTTTPAPTTPGSTLTHRPHRGPRPRGGRGQRLPAGGRAQGRGTGTSPVPRSRPTARRSRCAAGAVVNATGVWADDVRALDEGTHPDGLRPAKGIHITVPWDKVQQRHRRRCSRAQGQALGVRRAVGRPTLHSPTSAPPTPTTTARSTIPSARQTTSPTSCGRSTARSPPRSPRPTSSAPGPGCGPWSRRPRAGARPTCPGATACATSASGVDHRDRRQAHHVPRDGRRTQSTR